MSSQIKRGMALLIAASAIVLAAGYCGDDTSPMGFSLDETGMLVLYPSLCGDELVSRVGLVDTGSGSYRDFDPNGPGVVWEIQSDSPARLDRIVVGGAVPVGFEEHVRLTRLPDADHFLWGFAEIDYADGTKMYREQVYLEDLDLATIMAHGDRVAPEDWREYLDREFC